VEFWLNQGLLREITGQKRNLLFVAGELMQLMSGPRPAATARAGKEQTHV